MINPKIYPQMTHCLANTFIDRKDFKKNKIKFGDTFEVPPALPETP